jgi:hypothetical protein
VATTSTGVGERWIRWAAAGSVDGDVVESDAVAAVAIGGKRRRGGGEGRWGRNGATVQRALAPGNGRWRGRASDPAELGEAEIIWSTLCSSLWHASVEGLW